MLDAATLEPAVSAVVQEDMGRLPPVLTTGQVAKRLGVTTVTVARYIRDGLLPAYGDVRPFLIRAEDYLAFRRNVWGTLSGGKRGGSYKRRGRQHVNAGLLNLVFALRKLTGRR